MFHAGERAAQIRAGAGDMAARVGGFIRDYMPQQHRDFYTALPFVVLAAADAAGRPWVTVLEGEEGFIASPDDRTLIFDALPDEADPLAAAIAAGTGAGMLGIDLATRRRNRLNGIIRGSGGGLALAVRQSFGNCPRFISRRQWRRVEGEGHGRPVRSATLSSEHMERIAMADTVFIGSGYDGSFDASHRGGEAGFVRVVDRTTLCIPDYAGNNFFNTIGNLMLDPRVGLLFIDFATGAMLHITGTAQVDWEPDRPQDPAARRMIEIAIDTVVDRPAALSLRWQRVERP